MPSDEEKQYRSEHWLQHGCSDTSPYGGSIIIAPNIVNNTLLPFRIAMVSKWFKYDDDAYSYLSTQLSALEREKVHT